MQAHKSILTILFFCLCLPLWAQETEQAQDTTGLFRIYTEDGNEYIGEVLEMNLGNIVLKTENLGTITIKKENVKEMQRIDPEKMVNGQFWGDNHQATRYFWQANGYGLKKGEAYYQNVWVFFNQASVGISDNFSIGGGVVPLFLFAGAPSPIWITPKVSFPISKNKFNIGGGALIGTVPGTESGFFGIAYGVTTFGSRDKNVNIGVGYGFADGEFATAPTITVSAMARMGKRGRGYFITENYILTFGDPVVLMSLGGRTLWDRFSLDYGLFFPFGADLDVFVAIPWLGFSMPLGQKR